ncbi:MAG: hypothetical protein R6W88_10890 [Desulfobacterales bacterium]
MSDEKLDKRFGAIAIQKGFITLEQLLDAMKVQIVEDLEDAEHRLVGQILWERGYISTEQIKEVLESMGV